MLLCHFAHSLLTHTFRIELWLFLLCYVSTLKKIMGNSRIQMLHVVTVQQIVMIKHVLKQLV